MAFLSPPRYETDGSNVFLVLRLLLEQVLRTFGHSNFGFEEKTSLSPPRVPPLCGHDNVLPMDGVPTKSPDSGSPYQHRNSRGDVLLLFYAQHWNASSLA